MGVYYINVHLLGLETMQLFNLSYFVDRPLLLIFVGVCWFKAASILQNNFGHRHRPRNLQPMIPPLPVQILHRPTYGIFELTDVCEFQHLLERCLMIIMMCLPFNRLVCFFWSCIVARSLLRQLSMQLAPIAMRPAFFCQEYSAWTFDGAQLKASDTLPGQAGARKARVLH